MNPLYDSFPDAVTVDGINYPIVTDFREWIKFYTLVESDIEPKQKALIMLEYFMDDIPKDAEKALYALADFLSARELYQGKDTKRRASNRLDVQAYSFTEDAGDIYAGFLIHYGIDLSSVDYMHWYQFRVLFDSLPFESEIKQKMHYRTLNPESIKNKEERKRVREIQENIRLKNQRKQYVDDFDIVMV